MSNASNLSTLANVLDDGTSGQFLKSTGSGGVAFDTVAAGAVVYATADLLPLSGNSAGDMAYVTATNRFYINNGSGWYSVSLVNTNPNITSVADASSGTTPFTLATDGTATVITVTAADPEDIPLTYGYSVTSGSLNGSTVTQGTGSNTNVFTVTPHASQDATFTLTFTASDGINQATSANAFSLSFITNVTDSNHTTLLATATGTSDNDNITYIDGSGNSQNFTVTGSVTAGTFSPYRSGGYSMNFGSGASLKFAEGSTSNFNMGTNAFTIEMWIRPATTSSGSKRFYQNRISSMDNGKGSIFQNGSNLYATYRGDNGTDYELTASGVLTADTWTHVCLLRNTSDNTLKLYYDGTLGQSVSVPSTVGIYNSTSNTQVGLGDFGDIANLRVVNGTAITPSSSSILEKPENVTNTVLLMIGGNFEDYSGNAPQINNYYGPPEIKAYGPLDYPEYSSADYGGSVYFDASNYATISNFNQSITGNFTVECWVYVTGSNAGDDTFLKWGNLRFRSNNDSAVRGVANIGGFMSVGSGNTHTPNRWVHVVLDRSGNTLKAYKNGINFYHNTNYTASQVGHSGDLYLGWDGSSEKFIGYISDLRIVSESLYGSYGTSTSAANFNLPTAPLASNSNAILHFKGTDASIIDKSQGANLKLVGNTTGSTTQAKFSNTKSMYFGGETSGDYIRVMSTDEQLNLGKDPFTIEAWVFPDGAIGNNTILSGGQSSTNRFDITGLLSTGLRFFVSSTVSCDEDFTEPSANVWSHIAFVRNGTSLSFYINGTLDRTATISADLSLDMLSYYLLIGERGHLQNLAISDCWDGYIQDLRITKGLARYTANFTPPTAPLEG